MEEHEARAEEMPDPSGRPRFPRLTGVSHAISGDAAKPLMRPEAVLRPLRVAGRDGG
jgi:hypothetical protein